MSNEAESEATPAPPDCATPSPPLRREPENKGTARDWVLREVLSANRRRRRRGGTKTDNR